MRVKSVLIFVILACTSSCYHAELRDQFDKSEYDLSIEARLRREIAAPIIVQGKVTGIAEVGKVQPSAGDNRIKTQLVQITIAPELVIKGELDEGLTSFYFFKYSNEGPAELRRRRYLPEIGQRRMFFLKRDKGRLRSVGDVTDYTLRVSSQPLSRNACGSVTPGCCIARLIMVPGETPNPETFAVDLMKSVYIAEVLCSKSVAESLLFKLAESQYPQIAKEARELIRGNVTQ